MGFIQMSIKGSVVILAVIFIRTLLIHKLPKKTFLFLWGIALFRLLIPFSVSSEFSLYSLLQRNPNVVEAMEDTPVASFFEAEWNSQAGKASGQQNASDGKNISAVQSDPTVQYASDGESLKEGEVLDAQGLSDVAVAINRAGNRWLVVWMVGFLVCAGYFVISYLKCRMDFRFSTLVNQEIIVRWVASHPLKRRIRIRQSCGISAPLTYGIISPVILLPESTQWDESRELSYVLEHEFVHIKRLDAVYKFWLTVGLCVHWFNILAWIMYVLANRDLELSCDEAVVRRFGEEARASYARTLIHMEEKKSGLMPLCNNFSKNAIEERITAVMKIKKLSFATVLGAVILVCGVAFFLATSATVREDASELAARAEDGYTEEESSGVLLSSGVDEAKIQHGDEEESGSGGQQIVSEEEEREGQKITLQVSVEVSATDLGEGAFYSDGDKTFWYTLINNTDTAITAVECGMLAYDREGNPLKVCWPPFDSGETGSYYCTVKNNDISILPGEKDESHRGEYTIFDADNSWGLVELGTGEEFRVEMVLYCIKEVTFEDGTLWKNPEYEDWLANCKGKRVPSSFLWDYYPCQYTIDKIK